MSGPKQPDNTWRVRDMDAETIKKIKWYAVQHELTMAQAIQELTSIALREPYKRTHDDTSLKLIKRRKVLRNMDGDVIYMSGQLPDNTFGVVADTEKPLTEEEMEDPIKFKQHMDDLAKRIGT